VNRIEDRWESALWMVSADGSRNRFLAKGSNAVWSPDGTRIAYLADGGPKGPQIFVRFMDAEGATSQLTHAMEAPADLRWSPDGKRIAFSMVVPKTVPWKIDMLSEPKDAKWVNAPRIVETRHFRQDRRGFVDPGFRHLFVISADGGAPRQITRGDWSIGARFDALDGAVGFDWTPDGRTIVADGVADSTGDANYRNSNLYAIDVATGALKRLNAENGEWSSPVVSADGKRIAYRGYSDLTSSYHSAELYVMNIDGTGARRLSGDHDRAAEDVQWAADGRGV
jgi:Tol biopolymer transport system component